MRTYKISSNLVKNHIKYNWWKYFLVMVIGSLLCYYLTYLKNKIKPFERIQVYLSCEVIDNNYIEETYSLIDDTDIIDLTYYTCLPTEVNYSNALQSQGLGNSDLIIMPESKFIGAYIPSLSIFDDEIINRCVASYHQVEFLHFDNDDPSKICGVKIHSKTDNSYNENLLINHKLSMDENENYFILIPSSSCNMGKYGKYSDREIGLKLLDYFLKTYEN